MVPASAVLPEGKLELHADLGRRRRVAESAVAGFEVSEEQAREWLSGQLGRTAERLGENLREALRRAEASRRQAPAPARVPESWRRVFAELSAAGTEPLTTSSAVEGFGTGPRALPPPDRRKSNGRVRVSNPTTGLCFMKNEVDGTLVLPSPR
jgi:hypothetical protein